MLHTTGGYETPTSGQNPTDGTVRSQGLVRVSAMSRGYQFSPLDCVILTALALRRQHRRGDTDATMLQFQRVTRPVWRGMVGLRYSVSDFNLRN